MNDPYIPWWLVVLLGMWSVALTLWVRSNLHREIRIWSGLATLVYLALIFLALRVTRRQDFPIESSSTFSQLADFSFGVCLVVSLIASVYCLGLISFHNRLCGYLAHTFANACICALFQQPEVAIGLLIVFGVEARPLVRKLSMPGLATVCECLMTAIRFHDDSASLEKQGKYWLVGLMVSILAFTLFGTISYTLRNEMSHAASCPQQTKLPTRDRLREVLVNRSSPDQVASPLNLALSRRSEIPVLMTVIVFLHLARSMPDHSGLLTEGTKDFEDTNVRPPRENS